MTSSLEERRALVTAGALRIGRVIAHRLIEAGARCMVCDVDALFARVDQQLGGLEILVNNAGISGPALPAEELSLGDWCRPLAVNLDGHFLRSRRAGAWDDIVGALDPARCCKLNDPSGTNIESREEPHDRHS
jgi:NAD(P)-dependent dehydrogenase (short-subunit alcohol dehydrogenase family)